VERSREVAGLTTRFIEPAPGARRVVLSPGELEAEIDGGTRQRRSILFGASIGHAPPALQPTGAPINLAPDELRTFSIGEGLVQTIETSGDAAEAYWSVPHHVVSSQGERDEASFYLLGRRHGRTWLRVTWAQGAASVIAIDVSYGNNARGALSTAPSGQSQASSHECSMDMDCQSPARCIKPRGNTFRGVCGQPVDSMGMPQIAVDPQGQKCTTDLDCPMFSRCHSLGALSGVCVKS
jgi:hypothetical protein